MKVTFALLLGLTMMIHVMVNAKSLTLTDIQIIPILDSANQRQYELYIKLPERYHQTPDKTYPVIYYTDALWHVELLSAAMSFIMEDVILVGISWQIDRQGLSDELQKGGEPHVSRYRDYSFYPSSNKERQQTYRFGEADTQLQFIRKDVISYVESHYRTQPDHRTYFGYSMGGSFGAYILMTQPDAFKNYILGSPSVERLVDLETSKKLNSYPLNANVFIGHGTVGDNEIKRAGYVYQFIHQLNQRKDTSLSLKLAVIEGSHSSAFPEFGIQSIHWLGSLPQESK